MSGAPHGCCAYVFDLMQDDAGMHTAAPLEYRRALLRRLLKRARIDALRFSDEFADPLTLLDACAKHGLEGNSVQVARRPLSFRKKPRMGEGQDRRVAGGRSRAVGAVLKITVHNQASAYSVE